MAQQAFSTLYREQHGRSEAYIHAGLEQSLVL